MKSTRNIPSSLLRFRARTFLLAAAVLLLLLSGRSTTFAGSATWKTIPASGDWNTATNWVPSTVPNGPSDTATFDVSNTNSVSLSNRITVNGIAFNPDASAFTITANPGVMLTISGVGITNAAGTTQNFVTAVNGFDYGFLTFTHSATAGNGAVFTNNPATIAFVGGHTQFLESSSAGNGTFINLGSTVSNGQGGALFFFDTSTAGNGTFTNEGGQRTGLGGLTVFFDASTAGNGTFITNGGPRGITGGITSFHDTSTAANGTFITNGGTRGGALGGLIVFSDSSTAGTGSGAVQVNAGRLGGKGRIAGAVTLGTGSGPGAILSPGISGAGTLTIQSTLTLNPDATYNFELNSRTARADKVVANGVTISGAQFSFAGLGKALTPGTVFTVIDNTAATPITGTFSNLADGSIFTVNGHTFQASYEGGRRQRPDTDGSALVLDTKVRALVSVSLELHDGDYPNFDFPILTRIGATGQSATSYRSQLKPRITPNEIALS